MGHVFVPKGAWRFLAVIYFRAKQNYEIYRLSLKPALPEERKTSHPVLRKLETNNALSWGCWRAMPMKNPKP